MSKTTVSGDTRTPALDPDMFLTGYVTGIHRVTRGHRIAVAATVGATVLFLDEVADFIEGEGRSQVLVSGDVYDYDEVDPDANTITLATALTVAAAADDPVDLFDPEVGGTVIVGYEADVMLDDSDPTDRPISVDVSHALTQMLEESERGAFGEKITLLRTGEHQWTVWQIDGKIAANLAADAAVEAADSAFDQALAALTQAELVLAISDGHVDIYYQTSAPWADGSAVHDDDTGDVWVDTDAATPTGYRWLNRTWTVIEDVSIVAALLAAQSAQTTADGKIRLYVGTTFPTLITNPELSYGDLLRRTDQDNKEYYWDGDSWEPLVLGDDGIAAELIGKILTGAFIRTAASGTRIELLQAGGGGRIAFYNGAGGSPTGTIDGSSLGPGLLYVDFPASAFTGDVDVNQALNVGGLLHASSGIDVFGGVVVNTGGLSVSGSVELNALDGSGGSSFVMVGNSGFLSRGVPISLGADDSGGVGFKMLRTAN